MSEKKWITITVPVTEGPGLGMNGAGWFDDGQRGVAVHHEGRELRLMADDIGAAALVALRAPAGQRAEIQARHEAPTAENAEPGEPSDIWPIDADVYCKVCHKSHAARAGEKMCGGAGSWIPE